MKLYGKDRELVAEGQPHWHLSRRRPPTLSRLSIYLKSTKPEGGYGPHIDLTLTEAKLLAKFLLGEMIR